MACISFVLFGLATMQATVQLSVLFVAMVVVAPLVSSQDTTLSAISMKPGTAKFYDEDGRQRIFHGVNVVYKSPPYLPIQDHYDPQLSFSDQDVEYLQAWGLNIIRLGFMWPGGVPSNGTFNETYYEQAVQLVNNAARGGIYSLLDAHQDSFSEKFCGEGVPDWAAIPTGEKAFPEPLAAPFPIDPETGNPSFADCQTIGWSTYQFTYAASTGYQNLYDNYMGTADAFGAFWQKGAEYFKGNPNVIGFELLNEPFAGAIYKNEFLMLPEKADLQNLQPFYDILSPYIRNADPDRLVFFESVTWADIFENGEFGIGFTHPPGGAQHSNKSVLSFHYYAEPNFSINGPKGYMERRLEAAAKLNVGGMLTEFGITDTDSVRDDCDDLQLSWIAWDYKAFAGATVNGTCTGCGPGPINVNGSLNIPVIRGISRTYAQATAGDIISMQYNATTLDFELIYTINTECALPTEIYFNQAMFYSEGFQVYLLPIGIASWSNPSTNTILITHNASATNGATLTVVITAKQ